MAHCPSPPHPAGGIAAGLVSDLLQARAITCVTMLILAIPSVSLVHSNASPLNPMYSNT